MNYRILPFLALTFLASGCITNKRCVRECEGAIKMAEPFIRASERIKVAEERLEEIKRK